MGPAIPEAKQVIIIEIEPRKLYVHVLLHFLSFQIPMSQLVHITPLLDTIITHSLSKLRNSSKSSASKFTYVKLSQTWSIEMIDDLHCLLRV